MKHLFYLYWLYSFLDCAEILAGERIEFDVISSKMCKSNDESLFSCKENQLVAEGGKDGDTLFLFPLETRFKTLMKGECNSAFPVKIKMIRLIDGMEYSFEVYNGSSQIFFAGNREPMGALKIFVDFPGAKHTVFDKSCNISVRIEIDVLSPPNTLDYANLESFIADVRDSLPQKQSELIAYQGAVIASAGGGQALGCLIKQYKGDPIYHGMIEELSLLYRLNYGQLDFSSLSCNENASLQSKLDSCSKNQPMPTQFCLLYASYKNTRSWFLEIRNKISWNLQYFSASSLVDELKNLDVQVEAAMGENP